MSNPSEQHQFEFPKFPYPGLRPFEPAESPIFFGRERMIEAIIGLLDKQRLIVVHGSSGCGKSSVVRAGVLPSLCLEHSMQGRKWKTAIVRPAGGPLRNIAATLSREIGEPLHEKDPALHQRGWFERLGSGPSVLADIEAVLQAPLNSGGVPTRFCLVIDQFEELFAWTRTHGDAEAHALIEVLCALADSEKPSGADLSVILTMRSDYLGHCAQYENFAEMVNRCQYLLPCMDNIALLDAIHQPAELYGGRVDPDVGDRLLFKAREVTDSLPVIQHMLMRATRRAQPRNPSDWRITIDDILEIEGKDGALSTHVDEVCAEVTESNEDKEAAVQWMFRSLTGLDTGSRAIRRPCKLKDLISVSGVEKDIAISIIKAFCEEGRNFLNTNPPNSFEDETSVDISHEALIRNWPRMSNPKVGQDGRRIGWLHREFEAGLIWRALAVQAKDFLLDKRACLDASTTQIREVFFTMIEKRPAWTRRYLIDAQGKANPTEEPEWQAVASLMAASKENLQREREALKREREIVRRKERYRKQALGATVFATLVGVYAWQSLTETGMIMQTKSLVRAVETETRAGNPALAVFLALEALPERIDAPSRSLDTDALTALALAVPALQEIFVLSHDSSVVSAGFSNDGKRIVTASEDGTARIWDAATGAQLRILKHQSEVASAAFNPDGSLVVTELTDESARVWNIATGQEAIPTLRGLDSPEASAIFSPDGTRILATSRRGALVWDAINGKQISTLGDAAVRYAAFSPDSRQIVTASDDGIASTATIWDVATGNQIVLREQGTERQPSKTRCGNERGASPRGSNTRGGNVQENKIRSAAFSPDGTQIVTASEDHTACIWDAKIGRPIAPLRGHDDYVLSAVFSPDGKWIVTASEDHTARIWDAKTGDQVRVLVGHSDYVRSAVFSPDGRRIVTASNDKTARIWDAATGSEIKVLDHADVVRSAVFSPDGTRIVTASDDATARVWDALQKEDGPVVLPHEGYVLWAAFDQNGKRLVTASTDKTARVWDVTTNQVIGVLSGHQDEIYSAGFSKDGTRIVTASADKTARIWDATTGKEISVMRGHDDYVRFAAFSPNGREIVTASDDHTARVWDVETGTEIGKPLLGHGDYVRSAVFSPNGTQIVTASDDKTARLWDAVTGAELKILRGHRDYVRFAAFSPNGKEIVTASDDRTARVWDAATGKPLFELRGHEDYVLSASFRPNGTQVVTTSRDGTTRVWDAVIRQQDAWDAITRREAAVLRGHEAPVSSAAFSPDGGRIVTASEDSTARIWPSPLQCQELIDAAKSLIDEREFEPNPEQRGAYGLNRSTATTAYQTIRSWVMSLHPTGGSCDASSQ